ncbi:MAG: fluoride efflux transporter CrcB [Pedosphaera sp.]|nr:fluoride efflux transporter CrcB [Pedosphaera sp.]
MSYVWIFLGGGLGTIARFAGCGVVARLFGETFPWGTLLVNVSGSFIIGFFAALTETQDRGLIGSSARQFVMIGLCGGYTTFSSFSLQTLSLARNGEWFKAGANAVLSFGLCMIAVWLGHLLASNLNSSKGI